MALSEAKRAADKRHIAKLDNIMIRPYLEEGATIRSAAAATGKSVQGYVLEAVREKMERERAGGVPAGSPAAEDRPGVVMVSAGGSPGDNVCSRSTSLTPPDSTQSHDFCPEDEDDAQDDADVEQYPETIEEWGVWYPILDGEDVEEWRCRLNNAINHLSKSWAEAGMMPAVEYAKRVSVMADEDKKLYQRQDAASIAERNERFERNRQRLAELNAKVGGLSQAEDAERRRLMMECKSYPMDGDSTQD